MSNTTNNQPQRRAGLFDVRNVIGIMMACFGIILTLTGIVGDPELEKTGGVNANLWVGIALLGVALIFALWAWIRPTYVPAKDATTGAPSN
ncbi:MULTISPECIES: hypothetical protein [unclassified Actinobaculum]|uniref:hypothetical protein n=1 Tax=unclassified Actinobaculum TaxID=2609299 RepID=UPI000D529566|nr:MULTISPECIES: hypothetical protein [unclassified Actinobaculum]AWE43301.1 hypothetical protein DDD63_11705 [Actinobaculum sp. 313]RTE49803.1 hypothetical protein EKN07_04575 [Actinobaculum sp. 352]